MAVLGITQYELVPVPEFPGTVRYISPLRDQKRARVAAFSQRFFKPS